MLVIVLAAAAAAAAVVVIVVVVVVGGGAVLVSTHCRCSFSWRLQISWSALEAWPSVYSHTTRGGSYCNGGGERCTHK
jgi:hypothetical protein